MSSYCVLVLDFEIRLFHAASLKDKRQLRQRLIQRLRGQYNLSVTEVGSHDLWQRLDIAVAYVAISESLAEMMRAKLSDAVDRILAGEAEVIEVNAEIV